MVNSMPSQDDIKQAFLNAFPFATPRAEQLQAMDHLVPWVERLFIQGFRNPLFFGVDAPTGIGKSPLALTIALAIKDLYEAEHGSSIDEETGNETAQIWVVTQNKLLQDQYQRDFGSELFDLRGLDNYDCRFDPGQSCGTSKCGRIRGREDSKEKPPTVCSFKCEYDIQKDLSKKAPILSLNVAKALNLLKMGWKPLLMIFDEGHEVESALDSESTLEIKPDDLHKIDLPFPKYFSDLQDFTSVKEGMQFLLDDITPLKAAEESAPAAIRDTKRYKRYESLTNKIGETLLAMEEGIEFVSCSDENLNLKPLQVHKVFTKFFTFPTVFMSATLLSKKGFQSITGLDEKALEWFACQSPFPVENRPIKLAWRMGSQPLNYGNMDQEMPIVVKRIHAILHTHPDERGIIHTHTYKNAERVYNDLYAEFGNRLLFPKTSKEQKDALETHAKNPNSVLLSPSMTQGVDLKGDLCRFSVMMKVPWLPTGDPVVKARMEGDPQWYTYKTAQTVVQAPGRGVRTPDDFAITYLVDPGFLGFFNRAKVHLPKWFLESINTKPQGWY